MNIFKRINVDNYRRAFDPISLPLAKLGPVLIKRLSKTSMSNDIRLALSCKFFWIRELFDENDIPFSNTKQQNAIPRFYPQ
ncbi:hypothetical protein CWO92_17440 [Heyndrickxia camelliae]|uniref:Uncharacterized protein n=1 Tax=Heyndrickxia camelliae TaxID=1707093 RepID=A0A2N3LGR7_9BACI|nr:hypothetical protein CWO92_17440 [Heyndrickxia camelliae]